MPAVTVTETELQGQIVELARICGWRTMHVRRSLGRGRKWTTTTSVAGWPDLVAWRPGRFIAIEVKSATGKLSDEQTDVLASLTAAGVETYVVRPADFDAIATVLTGARELAKSDDELIPLLAQGDPARAELLLQMARGTVTARDVGEALARFAQSTGLDVDADTVTQAVEQDLIEGQA